MERFVSSRNPSTAEKFPRFPGAPQSRSSFRWGWTAASLVRSKSFSSMPCSPHRFGSSVCGRYSPINWRVKPLPSSGAWMVQASGPLFWNRSCSVPSPSHSSSRPVMSSISFLMLVPRRSSVLWLWFSRVSSRMKGLPRKNSSRSGCHRSQMRSERQGSAFSSSAESNGAYWSITRWLLTFTGIPPISVCSSLSMASLKARRRSSGMACHRIWRYTSWPSLQPP